jgi:hypothetical protein
MKGYLVFIFTVFQIGLFAQQSDSNRIQDSINDAKIINDFYYKTKFQVSLSNQRTLLTSGVDIKINALNIGFQFKHHYKVGIYGLLSDQYRLNHLETPGVAYYDGILLGYGAYFEYVLLENYRYYVGFPFTVSNAWVNAIAFDEGGNRLKEYQLSSDKFGMTSLGVSAGYNINYWLTFLTGVGYRAAFSNHAHENNLLSTPFYTFGIKVKLGSFITTISRHKDVLKMKSIYFRDKDTWRGNKFKKRHPNL